MPSSSCITVTVACLWARCERFARPQLVAAVSDSLVDCFREEADRLKARAEEWYADFGDEQDWTFWVTYQHITADPLAVLAEEASDVAAH